MFQIFYNFAARLLSLPSRGENEPDAIFEWRQRVAVSLIILGGIEMTFILAAMGFLTIAGISGYARADAVAALVQQSLDTRVAQIERGIKDDRTAQCYAIMAGNQVALNYSYQSLQTNLDAFIAATHSSPRIPGCSELIPEGAPGIIPRTPIPTAPAAK